MGIIANSYDAAGSVKESSESNSWLAWVVTFCASFFFFYEFMLLNSFNALNVPLIREFQISAERLGQLSANYFYANLCFLFPAGIILDRVSTRKVILLAMSTCVLSTFVFSYAPNIYVAMGARFVTGTGGAFCLLSCIRLASRWFPAPKMALVTGLIVTFAMMGGVVAQTPLTLLTEAIGWRKAIFTIACSGTVMVLLIYAFVRDYPAGFVKPSFSTHDKQEISFWQSLRMSLGNLQTWLAGLYTSLLNLPIFILGAMWGSMYLQQIHGISRIETTYVTQMIFFGTVVGSPFVGWLSDRIGLRKLPMFVFGVLSLISMLLVIYVSGWSLPSLMMLFFAIGFFTSAQIISYPLIAESNPRALTGTSLGIASTIIMGGGISQPFCGWLLERNWDHKIIDGVPVYSVSDFNSAMLVMPIAFVIGLVCVLLLKETRCIPKD